MSEMTTYSHVRPRLIRLRRFVRNRAGLEAVWWVEWERRSKRRPRPIALLAFRCPQYREAFAHG